VLVIAGISSSAVNGGLSHAAANCSPSGIALNVFDSLDYLPSYSETVENQPLPRPVVKAADGMPVLSIRACAAAPTSPRLWR